MKVLIDTNVILDFFLARQPQFTHADRLFELVGEDKIEAFTTASCITDIHYVLQKKLGADPARNAIRQLLKMLTAISVDGSDCAAALDVPIFDYEDALVVTCSAKEAVEYIVTNDSDFIKMGDGLLMRVVSPAGFLNSDSA